MNKGKGPEGPGKGAEETSGIGRKRKSYRRASAISLATNEKSIPCQSERFLPYDFGLVLRKSPPHR